MGKVLKLQCGHDPKAVENHGPVGVRHTANSPASMRPRPEGRGEQDFHNLFVVFRHALQCGHDPKAVENDDA